VDCGDQMDCDIGTTLVLLSHLGRESLARVATAKPGLRHCLGGLIHQF